MERLIKNMNRWIYALLDGEQTFEEEKVINFFAGGKAYCFKFNLVVEKFRDWTVTLYEVNYGMETYIDGLKCNAGHKQHVHLLTELLLRRHCKN